MFSAISFHQEFGQIANILRNLKNFTKTSFIGLKWNPKDFRRNSIEFKAISHIHTCICESHVGICPCVSRQRNGQTLTLRMQAQAPRYASHERRITRCVVLARASGKGFLKPSISMKIKWNPLKSKQILSHPPTCLATRGQDKKDKRNLFILTAGTRRVAQASMSDSEKRVGIGLVGESPNSPSKILKYIRSIYLVADFFVSSGGTSPTGPVGHYNHPSQRSCFYRGFGAHGVDSYVLYDRNLRSGDLLWNYSSSILYGAIATIFITFQSHPHDIASLLLMGGQLGS